MRKRNSNNIDNAWKRLNRSQQNKSKSKMTQTIRSADITNNRNGQLQSGATSLFNLSNTSYIAFGAGPGSGTVVAP